MQYKLAFLFALLVCCSQALTANQTAGTGSLFEIDSKRHKDLVTRMMATNISEHRDYHLMNAVGSFAFTCSQLYPILDAYPNAPQIFNAFAILKDNIIDPQNNYVFFKWFNEADKQKLIKIFSNISACNTQGVAPEKFPIPAIPYKDKWTQTDLDALIKKINNAYLSDEKLRIAQAALTSSSKVLSTEQTSLLYESFSSISDMLTLTEYIKEKVVGLTCDQVIFLLTRFYFDDMKLTALEAFKQDIIDIENKLSILDSFRQPKTQALASKILADLKPKNSIFDTPAGNVLFLIDVSGSMDTQFTLSDGQKISRLDFVRREIAKALNSLNETSQFNVLTYASGISIWKGYGLQKASKANIGDAMNFTNQFIAYGGTNTYSILQLAWTFSGVDTIYLLTDGSPNEGIDDTSKIVADVKTWYAKTPIKINSIAFLMGTNTYSEDKSAAKKLMSALAEATNGRYKVLESDK